MLLSLGIDTSQCTVPLSIWLTDTRVIRRSMLLDLTKSSPNRCNCPRSMPGSMWHGV